VSWRFEPHGPLIRLEDDLWTAVGSVKGMQITRRMVVARRRDGRLVIHSAVSLDDAAMRELESLGEPAFLLVPGRYHRKDAAAWLARYPGMKVLAPRGAVNAARAVVRVDGTYEDHPQDPDVILVPELAGTEAREGAMIVRSDGTASLALCDAVFNLPHAHGLEGFLMRYVTSSTGGPRVSRLFRWTSVKDRAALGRHLLQLADTPGLKRVLPAHGEPIDGDAAGTLRRVALGS
jgi:hypothetical protein